jgi:hypothetical protein
MDVLFLILFLLSLAGLIIGLIKPFSLSRLLKEKATRKNSAKIFGTTAIIFFVLFGMITSPKQTTKIVVPAQTTQKQKAEVVQQIPPTNNQPAKKSETQISDSVIGFDKLREWNPDDDTQAIGLEILISKEDVTKEGIIKLVKSITSNTQKAVVKIYQNKQAWNEEQSGNYTSVFNEGYLAFCVKNLTNSGAYRGFNEIRWMQEKGNLQDLFGDKMKLE